MKTSSEIHQYLVSLLHKPCLEMKNVLLWLIVLPGLLPLLLNAQILTVTPENPTADSTITFIYDASEGNGELAGYHGDVYMHTGVISAESTHPGDWKYVVTDWCENTAETKLLSLGNNLYQATYNIRSFYGIPENEMVLKLAFVFRNAECNLVGRDDNNQDIFYDLAIHYNTTEYISHEFAHDSLLINCSSGEIIVTPFSENIINIFSHTPGEENQPSYSVVATKQNVEVSFNDYGNLLIFRTDSVDVIIDTADLSFRFVYNNDTILHFMKIYEFSHQGILVSQLKEQERIYGSGARAIDMDRKGKKLSINNQAHYGYGIGAENLNITLPLVNSTENYMIFYDNHSIASLDIGSSNGNQMSYTFNHGQADVFVIAGKSHGELIKNYSILTGFQPIPPLWSLGYIQSKYGYETQTEAYNIVNRIKNANFPLDALVLDLYWFGNTNTMGNLNWDYSRFPNPQGMMTDFRDLGVKTILISEPYFTLNSSNYTYANNQNYFATDSNGDTYVLWGFWAGNSALLDIFNPQAANWFKQFYTNRTNEGAAGWWTDLGEPETHPSDMVHFGGQSASEIHNVFSLEWEKLVYENWQAEFPEKRLFNLSRSGFAGMQRYATFPWSGDIQRSFDGLKAQIPMMLSMGMGGVPFMHSDVGGFTGGGNDDELFIRWVQMGVFAPVFRIHGTGIETAPTAYGSNAQTITRKYIKWRYELLPYNYSLAYEAAAFGKPPARPMDFYEMKNTSLQNLNDQFFWGDNLIVAPILYQGQTQRNVVLPKGKWLNYQNLTEYVGPGNYTMPAPLTEIPVLVKAGSFIPTVKNLLTTDDYIGDKLYIKYYPDESVSESEYTLFDDSKTNPKSLIDNEFNLTQFRGSFLNNEIEIRLGSYGFTYPGMTLQRQFIFEIYRIPNQNLSVLLDDVPMTKFNSLNELEIAAAGFYYNLTEKKLYVSMSYQNLENTIRIENINNIEVVNSGQREYTLLPNPTKNIIHIYNSNPQSGSKEITIYNSTGKSILVETAQLNEDYIIDAEMWESGVYYIRIRSIDGKQEWTRKFIKQ